MVAGPMDCKVTVHVLFQRVIEPDNARCRAIALVILPGLLFTSALALRHNTRSLKRPGHLLARVRTHDGGSPFPFRHSC